MHWLLVRSGGSVARPCDKFWGVVNVRDACAQDHPSRRYSHLPSSALLSRSFSLYRCHKLAGNRTSGGISVSRHDANVDDVSSTCIPFFRCPRDPRFENLETPRDWRILRENFRAIESPGIEIPPECLDNWTEFGTMSIFSNKQIKLARNIFQAARHKSQRIFLRFTANAINHLDNSISWRVTDWDEKSRIRAIVFPFFNSVFSYECQAELTLGRTSRYEESLEEIKQSRRQINIFFVD